MVYISLAMVLTAKPSFVWSCLLDETLLSSWIEGVSSATRVSDEAGAAIEFTITIAGRQEIGQSLVTASREGELYALETRVGDKWLLLDTIRLRPDHEGTCLEVASELVQEAHDLFHFQKVLDKIVPLMGAPRAHPIEAAYHRSFASFKKLVETRAERPYR